MPKIRKKPVNDWTCREVLDAKAVSPNGKAACAFCGTRIRWIHMLEHDDWPRRVEAGCCCAQRLCFEYDAEGAEREYKNRLSRQMRFVDQARWSPSKNNPANIWRWTKLRNGHRVRVTVFMSNGTYGIFVAYRKDNDKNYCHPARFRSREEAMMIAFELVDKE